MIFGSQLQSKDLSNHGNFRYSPEKFENKNLNLVKALPGGKIVEIKFKDNYAYCPASGILLIFNISDRLNPVLVGQIKGKGDYIRDVDFYENYILIADGRYDGILIYDISEPSNPVYKGEIKLLPTVYSLEIRDNLLYAVTRCCSYFYVLDIKDLFNPEVLDKKPMTSPINLWVEDAYAYIADYKYGLKIIDIRNPRELKEVGVYNIPNPSNPKVYQVRNVMVKGNIAFLSAYDDGVIILDISNKNEPKEILRIP